MLRLIKENTELIQTIIAILEVFPESVIIQSFNYKTKQYDLKFMNEAAKNKIIFIDHDESEDFNPRFKLSEQENVQNSYDIRELLLLSNNQLIQKIKHSSK